MDNQQAAELLRREASDLSMKIGYGIVFSSLNLVSCLFSMGESLSVGRFYLDTVMGLRSLYRRAASGVHFSPRYTVPILGRVI